MWTGTTMADPESMAAARRGKRVLLMGETVTLAHIARPVVLAQGLHRAGYTVYLAADPRYQSLLPALPFPTYELRSGAPDDFLRRIDMGSALFDVDTLERYVQEDLALFRELAPHVVIGDMRHSLAVSSRLYGIPYLNVINANWSPYCDSELVLMEHPLMDLVGEPLVQTLFGLMRPLGGTLHSLPLNVVCARHGLPMLGTDPKQVYTYGDYTLYPDTPALIPTRKLPFNHLYIGPILWSPNVAQPQWWDEVPGDRPAIYVNLGSSGNASLLEEIVRTLAELPVTVLAATAGRCQIDNAPQNVYVADFLPGDAAAARAKLVICNGGSANVQQALATGTPFLGIVNNLDQWMWARIAQSAGAGLAFRTREVKAVDLRDQVALMLADDAYAEAAQRVAADFARYNAADAVTALVDRITLARR